MSWKRNTQRVWHRNGLIPAFPTGLWSETGAHSKLIHTEQINPGVAPKGVQGKVHCWGNIHTNSFTFIHHSYKVWFLLSYYIFPQEVLKQASTWTICICFLFQVDCCYGGATVWREYCWVSQIFMSPAIRFNGTDIWRKFYRSPENGGLLPPQ